MVRPRERFGRMLAGAAVAVLAVLGLSWETTTVVQTVRQPASVAYPDGSVHVVAVKRHTSIGAPVVGGTRHELWLGRDPSLAYGHAVALDITGSDPERFEVAWSERGVTVAFASGHEIVVPATAFTGGR